MKEGCEVHRQIRFKQFISAPVVDSVGVTFRFAYNDEQAVTHEWLDALHDWELRLIALGFFPLVDGR